MLKLALATPLGLQQNEDIKVKSQVVLDGILKIPNTGVSKSIPLHFCKYRNTVIGVVIFIVKMYLWPFTYDL